MYISLCVSACEKQKKEYAIPVHWGTMKCASTMMKDWERATKICHAARALFNNNNNKGIDETKLINKTKATNCVCDYEYSEQTTK